MLLGERGKGVYKDLMGEGGGPGNLIYLSFKDEVTEIGKKQVMV